MYYSISYVNVKEQLLPEPTLYAELAEFEIISLLERPPNSNTADFLEVEYL